MALIFRYNRFWATYLGIRVCYLLFTILVYSNFTSLGDTHRYLSAGLNFSFTAFLNSTSFMEVVGGISGYFFRGLGIFSNLPFTLYSFVIVRWTIQKLESYKYVPSCLLLFMISLPNFCIWTSLCSKEIFGLTFSAILGVLIVNFIKGDYKIRFRDIIAIYLCLLFKPQYFPFIFQGLVYIYITGKWFRSLKSKFFLGVFMLFLNLVFLYLISDIVNQYAGLMHIHFNPTRSTRENMFLADNDFFKLAPSGMFIAFWGPTFGEMLEKPTHLIAGIESFIMMCFFVFLAGKFIARFLCLWRVNVRLFFSYFIIVTGICFIHYPFGIFNSGSAIRYRTNFIFLFILLFLYLYVYFKIDKSKEELECVQ